MPFSKSLMKFKLKKIFAITGIHSESFDLLMTV